VDIFALKERIAGYVYGFIMVGKFMKRPTGQNFQPLLL
jgi:hypothetical protein